MTCACLTSMLNCCTWWAPLQLLYIMFYNKWLKNCICLLPEGEFGLEHSLSLQSSALSDEQVVVVSLKRSFVNVKHFIPEVEWHAATRKSNASTSEDQYQYFFYRVTPLLTCRRTTSQYERYSPCSQFPPRLSWLSTELYSPPAGGKYDIEYSGLKDTADTKACTQVTTDL